MNTLFVPSEASGVGESRTWEQAVASCLELCATCARCRHISVSPTLAYCAWHHRCDATGERDEAAACGVLSEPFTQTSVSSPTRLPEFSMCRFTVRSTTVP